LSLRNRTILDCLLAAYRHVVDGQRADRQAGVLNEQAAATSSWACQAKVVEIAGSDTNGRATAGEVHRVQGEIVAAELSASEVEQVRRLPCQGDRLEAPPPLVG
jgi:hypothetical protein